MSTFESHTWACPDLSVVGILKVIHKEAAVVHPLATSAVATCFKVYYDV